jgi:hypothetical protein
MRSYLPYELVAAGFVALNGCLFFVLAARRIGALALAPTAVLLFFGAAYEVTGAGTLRLTELMSVAAGLGMLLCLESFERRRLLADLAAAALLLASLFSHPLGLAFAVAGGATILARGRRAWRGLPVVVAPVVIWLVTWLSLRPGNQPAAAPWSTVPRFVVESAAAVGSAITGATRFGAIAGTDAIQWAVGSIVVAAAAVLLVGRMRRGWRPSALFWGICAALALLWVLEAHAPGADRSPESSRYMYPGGILMLLGLCELGAGIRLRLEGVIVFTTVAAVALALSIDGLRVGSGLWVQYSDFVRAEETSIRLARDHVDPNLLPESPSARPRIPYSGFGIRAGAFLELSDLWGFPGYSARELSQRPPQVRNDADLLLGRALGLALTPPSARKARAAPGCARAAISAGSVSAESAIPKGGARLMAPDRATPTRLRRFGPSGAYPLGRLGRRSAATLAIPGDSASQPWRIVIRHGGPIEVCPLPGA